jgi:hypothetical protein
VYILLAATKLHALSSWKASPTFHGAQNQQYSIASFATLEFSAVITHLGYTVCRATLYDFALTWMHAVC